MAGQTKNGKAFEYACLIEIKRIIAENNKTASIVEDIQFENAKKYYDELNENKRKEYEKAAKVAIELINPLEPKLKNGNGILVLSLNDDRAGELGDVRDIVCKRNDDNWEIGFSCKHNHEALKHPRLTKNPDFGSVWINKPCSNDFKEEIKNIMRPLEKMPQGTLWRDIDDKQEKYYSPILNAFKKELFYLCNDAESCKKLLGYFFGNKDFYKIIAQENDKIVKIEAFNMFGSLNEKCGQIKPSYKIKELNLPTELACIQIKNNTTLEVYMNNGWNFTMRLHNKDSEAKITGLAWDVNLVGIPSSVYFTNSCWQ